MNRLCYILFIVVFVVNAQNKTLDSLYAFPSAFGSGKWVDGGRGGTFYEVTNLNDSGAGSFREAVEATGDRIIIIKVEGLVNLSSAINANVASNGNVTIWGQFAPGNGITLSDYHTRFDNCNNIIIRHTTFQHKTGDGGSIGSLRIEDLPANGGVYIDHVSARYGFDQTIDIISRETTNTATVAYSILAEGDPSAGTGGIMGDSGSGAADTGSSTWARNFFYNISHRLPNVSGSIHEHENYNNYGVNWERRLVRTNGGVTIDYFHNYMDRGNVLASSRSSTPVNKIGNPIEDFRTYTGFNFVGEEDETPTDNQTGLWVNFKNNSEGLENAAILPYHYVTNRQHSFGDPEDGIWDWSNVKDSVLANAGHNRGINADGTSGFFRDDKDTDYVNKATNGTTETTYRATPTFDNSAFSGTSLYTDTDGDYMPDWFENQHSHLNPNDSADRDGYHRIWDFGSYTVTNDAREQGSSVVTGYTNLEMCAAYYANDFEAIPSDGVITAPTNKIKLMKSRRRQ